VVRHFTRVRAAICLIIVLFAVGCHGPVKELYPPRDGERAVDVLVVNNHWHTGFVLSYAQLSPRLQRLMSSFHDERWVEIGWGDAAFYPAPRATSGLALQAMFFSRGSVLHVAGFDELPVDRYREYQVELYRVRISEAGYARLMDFLTDTFATRENGDSIELGPGLYGFSRFYRARGKYGAVHTCNNWLADGIRATGFPITPGWAFTAGNAGWQIKHFGRRYDADLLLLDR
jgi:uncharacterized protein (TIGR02117 family)